MRVIARLQDTEFPLQEITHTRQIVRGIVYDDDYRIALIRVHHSDEKFGERDMYETPGGGKNPDETLLEGFKREIKEEVGADLDNIIELGRVVDYYNKIGRRNDNHYFMGHIVHLGHRHLEEYERNWGLNFEMMSIEEAIYAYELFRDLPVNNLVKQRELPVLKLAKKKLDKIKKQSNKK